MENSGEVTVEGENYEVVDECVEEEDTSNKMQSKCVKQVDVEKQSTDVTIVNTGTQNKDIEQSNDINMEKNENTSKENNKNINNENINKENKENNEDTNKVKIDENTNKEDNEDTNKIKIDEDTNKEDNEDTNKEDNEDTNKVKIDEDSNKVKIDEDSNKVKIDENTNKENNEDANKANNETINIQTNEGARIEESSDINMVKDDDIVVIDVIDNSSLKNSDCNINIQNNPQKESQQQLSMDTIDFTEDITLDQFNQQKDVTDEDVLHHLDAIENIVLDSRDFQVRKENHENECYNSENNSFTEKVEENENLNTNEKTPHNMNKDFKLPVKIDNFAENEWYEKKLAEKEAIIKERLTKVAKVLGISYPCYEQWLEYEETLNGTPLCKLKPSRRCCLDKPHTNRWKFICTRRRIEESILIDDINTSCNKNAETVWKVEPSGQWGVNVNNASEFPDFVLRAVKVFEDFLQTTDQLTSQNSVSENFSDDTSVDTESKKDAANEAKQYWLWLVVRCNSMDELMLFATGKNISRSTMDKLKQVYESGSGKDCNVKSLYCKSTNKYDDTTVTDTTFLVGSEALDEIVGGLKVQLAPKTNFWSNTAGAVNVANTVMDLLAPNPKTTVLEIGCGIGLIGLMLASKCQQIIGVDNPSEVEEAELTCELNNIKNASFIMGSPHEVTTKIINAVKNRKTFAIINANTNIGRATEVMTCLRKIPSLKRIAMITTLTKQSVRAILELARPGDQNHGAPFIPVVACVVDTLPIGTHFEAVIILQRRTIHKLNPLWFQKAMQGNIKNVENKTVQNKINEQNVNEKDKKLPGKGPELQTKQKFNKPNQLTKIPAKKSKVVMNKLPYTKNAGPSLAKPKFKGKRPHSPEKADTPPKKLMKKLNKFGPKPWQTDASIKKKKEWNTASPELRINPLYEKKIREHKEQTDLRERLSNNRVDTDIAQTVKEHQALLEIAKEKLSGPAPTVDVNTAKQLQNMLNMVLEQTSKLQNQLPRSVWDRIAPPENINLDQKMKDDALFKDRYIQEMNSQDILITTPNKTFLNSDEPEKKPIYKKYHNLLPLEPNTVMPPAQAIGHKDGRSFRITFERFHENDMRQQQTQENSWNRGNTFERNRWNEMGNMKKSMSPIRRQPSPKRPLLSPPRRPCSPPRRHFSPLRRPVSPVYRQRSPMKRQMSPLRRPVSPRRMSPSWQPLSPRRLSSPRRTEMYINRSMSPLRRQASPSRRPMSPMRSAISPSRRETSTMKRPMSPARRQIPSPNRMMSTPNKQELLFPKTQTIPQERQQTSTMRRAASPPRFLFEHPTSPPRRQQSPQRRQMSPQRFPDDWDIPSRGAIEQTWNRSNDRVSEQNVWQMDKASATNWGQTTCNDRSQKSLNQDKWVNQKITVRNDNWNSGANDWGSKTWSSGADNRWSATPNMPGSSTDNWNIHGKDNFPGSKDPWMDNKKQAVWEPSNVKDSWKQIEKEDVNDLPEDAKDPWGDDGTSDLKERWLKYENSGPSSVWVRESEQGDSWRKHNKDNWQNKGTSFTTKPQWQNNGVQNAEESRWHSQNDGKKKAPSSNWQNRNTTASWQFKNSNFQSQRSFSTNQFKGY